MARLTRRSPRLRATIKEPPVPTQPAPASSFARHRGLRTASGLATAGLLAGMSILLTGPAAHAVSCDVTLDGAAATSADIQTALDDPTKSVICLIGTFSVPTTLSSARDVTLLGLPNAVLDAGATDHKVITAGSSLTLQNLRLTGGRSGSSGGGISAQTLVVIDSSFDDNQTIGWGGAIRGTDVTIHGSTFTNNTSGEDGGAVTGSNTLTITSSSFSQNHAGQFGGAVDAYNVLTVDASTFDSNIADFGGGAAADTAGDAATLVRITNSTFVGNEMSAAGSTGFGGAALLLLGSATTVEQSTFLDNVNAVIGGDQAIRSQGGVLGLHGNIFANDTEAKQITLSGGSAVDQGGNLFTTLAATETDFAASDPSTTFGLTTGALFGSAVLANNGGPVQTVALPASSVAIDAVPGASTVTVDARGEARTLPNDAGAFEYVAPVPVVPAAPTLAATGSDPTWPAAFGAALLALGAVALRLAQRARRTTSRS